jgi:hypothetical protein
LPGALILEAPFTCIRDVAMGMAGLELAATAVTAVMDYFLKNA